jgi:hypothetical protein
MGYTCTTVINNSCLFVSLYRMTTYTLVPAKAKANKYSLIITGPDTKKTVSFGAKGYQDYTTHHDTNRRDRYE